MCAASHDDISIDRPPIDKPPADWPPNWLACHRYNSSASHTHEAANRPHVATSKDYLPPMLPATHGCGACLVRSMCYSMTRCCYCIMMHILRTYVLVLHLPARRSTPALQPHHTADHHRLSPRRLIPAVFSTRQTDACLTRVWRTNVGAAARMTDASRRITVYGSPIQQERRSMASSTRPC